MKKKNSSLISKKYESLRIDRYLAQRFTYLSRSQWQKEIQEGRIKYNGSILSNHHKKIKTGDTIDYINENNVEPHVETNYSIIYEDEFLIAVNKPGNLPVHPAGKFFNNTLLMLLQEDLNLKLYPVHRLDRETSGIIIMAKNSATASLIQSNFTDVHKSYTAIVYGIPDQKIFIIDVPIGNDRNSKVRKKRSAYPTAREKAVTEFELIKSSSEFSLIKAYPKTGRNHQIRVHCNYAGHPIVGDKLYGRDENYYLQFIEHGLTIELENKLILPRCALHAETISFSHPHMNKNISLSAPLPVDMNQFIKSWTRI